MRNMGLARKLAIAAVAAASTLSLTSVALAYFTNNASAEGGFVLSLEPKTDIHETYGGREKHVTISNADGSVPVYVRARAFSSLEVSYAGGGWEQADDGWLYYGSPLMPGDDTSELVATISFPTGRTETVTGADGSQTSQTTADPRAGERHDVIVVYECVPVLYGADGSEVPASECWSAEGGR